MPVIDGLYCPPHFFEGLYYGSRSAVRELHEQGLAQERFDKAGELVAWIILTPGWLDSLKTEMSTHTKHLAAGEYFPMTRRNWEAQVKL